MEFYSNVFDKFFVFALFFYLTGLKCLTQIEMSNSFREHSHNRLKKRFNSRFFLGFVIGRGIVFEVNNYIRLNN